MAEADMERCISFEYLIEFSKDRSHRFRIDLDPDTLELRTSHKGGHLPEWTTLGFGKCRVCPLEETSHTHCPVAVSMVELVDFFKDFVSHWKADVTVSTGDRQYRKRTTVQTLLSSMVGIYMVTSGCPVLDRLRPMVETHLPFSSPQDTVYRTVSMYLFAQYALNKHGLQPDWTLEGLVDFYHDVTEVNSGFCQRLNAIPHEGDANINALAILNSMALITRMSVEEDRLAHWESLFLRHWGR
ncbi:MAG: hypothetical protein GXP54_03220 [Deltaproteobacteria bacterium]|nr:hypothetical protein [Deltaproteobacteria bacterium]